MDTKRKIIIILVIILITAGCVLLLFPPVSKVVNANIANNKADDFDNTITNVIDGSFEDAYKSGLVDEDGYQLNEKGRRVSNSPCVFSADLDRLLEDVKAYNEELVHSQRDHFVDGVFETTPIALKDYGIFDNTFGYIEIPKIELKLPIYLGATNYNLSYGIGHMSYTSLPVRGNHINVSLAGHTGYVGRTFFDNIKKLKKGDSVKIHNYWETIEYEVVETKVVAPNDAQHLLISYGETKLTLVTCISNGNGGFDRYLVVCKPKTE